MNSPVSRRLSEAMAPEVQELIYRPRLDQEIEKSFDHVIDVNQAHVLMLVERDIIDAAVGKAVAAELIEIEREGASAISRDPSREDMHFNFEATLIARTGAAVGGRIHIGRSRNDMGAAVDRMRARACFMDIAATLNEVRRASLDQAKAHAKTVMPGYTHLQAAQPITFGFYCLGIGAAMQRDYARLSDAYPRINLSPMGAAAFAGTSFDIDRHRVAELLGFDRLVEHALDAVASRDFLVELAGVCTGLGITWSRLAQDFYVWSTREFALLDFPDRVAGTSSIMPQKKNPVVLEYLKATSAQNVGSAVSLLATMRASHFTNSIDGVRSSTLGAWQVLETTAHSLPLVRLIMESAMPQGDAMLRRARTSFATVTDLADMLVRDCGLSFREAHHIVGAVVRMAIEQDKGADQIDARMIQLAAEQEGGHTIELSEAVAALCGDPVASVDQRRSRGGPCAGEMERLHADASAQLQDDENALQQTQARLQRAREALKRCVHELAAA